MIEIKLLDKEGKEFLKWEMEYSTPKDFLQGVDIYDMQASSIKFTADDGREITLHPTMLKNFIMVVEPKMSKAEFMERFKSNRA